MGTKARNKDFVHSLFRYRRGMIPPCLWCRIGLAGLRPVVVVNANVCVFAVTSWALAAGKPGYQPG